MTDSIERELHLTSFFLFLTLGIFPSFIFLGFFFFCCLSDSSSEKKLSSGVRGTVLRSPSSSSSRHTETKYYLLLENPERVEKLTPTTKSPGKVWRGWLLFNLSSPQPIWLVRNMNFSIGKWYLTCAATINKLTEN